MNCSLPGSSVLGILQARILEWVAMFFSRGLSQSRNWNFVSCLASGFFTTEPPFLWYSKVNWETGFDIWVLYILGILMPYQVCGLLISSVSCLFFLSFFSFFFCCAQLIILMLSHLFTFVLTAVLLGSIQKTVAKTISRNMFPIYSSRNALGFCFYV